MGKSAVCKMYKTVGRSEIKLFVLNRLVTLTDRAKLRLYSQLIAQDKRIKLNRARILAKKALDHSADAHLRRKDDPLVPLVPDKFVELDNLDALKRRLFN